MTSGGNRGVKSGPGLAGTLARQQQGQQDKQRSCRRYWTAAFVVTLGQGAGHTQGRGLVLANAGLLDGIHRSRVQRLLQAVEMETLDMGGTQVPVQERAEREQDRQHGQQAELEGAMAL